MTPVLCAPPCSCDQAVLWLPAASEASHAPHLPSPAAGHHVGWTQTQDLQFLAQYRTPDTLQKMSDRTGGRAWTRVFSRCNVFLSSKCESTLWVVTITALLPDIERCGEGKFPLCYNIEKTATTARPLHFSELLQVIQTRLDRFIERLEERTSFHVG